MNDDGVTSMDITQQGWVMDNTNCRTGVEDDTESVRLWGIGWMNRDNRSVGLTIVSVCDTIREVV